MCWALNHQNTLEMAQGHISLSASHSQASWPQLPPPPPLPPTQSQQPEGRQHSQQQREIREESEAHTVNSTVPESKHIY
jgi:hypothetical protein